jgi:hypothetical protein
VKCDSAKDKDDSAFRTEAAVLLKSQIESFKPDRFPPRMVLLQKIDRTNNVTSYIMPSNNKTLYKRDGDDSNAKSVVLTAFEDMLPVAKKKRSFIVFRKKDEASEFYRVNFAMIR